MPGRIGRALELCRLGFKQGRLFFIAAGWWNERQNTGRQPRTGRHTVRGRNTRRRGEGRAHIHRDAPAGSGRLPHTRQRRCFGVRRTEDPERFRRLLRRPVRVPEEEDVRLQGQNWVQAVLHGGGRGVPDARQEIQPHPVPEHTGGHNDDDGAGLRVRGADQRPETFGRTALRHRADLYRQSSERDQRAENYREGRLRVG